ncbi:MAG: hypothetical protein M3314_00925, partial [Actinomycetota bacterium]|nr:hypothetical protein [Actinomycetota bacterium]
MGAVPEEVDRLPVVSLDDPGALDAQLVGAKAAALATARRAGLPVLEGAVLTTGLTTTTRGLAALAAWTRVSYGGTRRLVVRSSSTVEDGREQSMAGLFTSVVDVRTMEDFHEAVDAVLASGASGKVVALADERAPLAVLVQPLVQPRVGGVLFGVDPVSGRRDRLVVAASEKGPVGLVQGEDDGDTATLNRHGRLLAGTSPLTRGELRQLAHLSRKVNALFGSPQDVEWAIDHDGHLWLLQSRPVTAVAQTGKGPLLGPGPVAETFPDPLSPLEQDLWVEPLKSAVLHALELAGTSSHRTLRRSPVVTSVGGRVAVDLDLFDATTASRHGLARLNPGPPTRRLVAAWRVGRLRAALPALARDLVDKADSELAGLRPLEELDDEVLLGVLTGARDRLVALHGHEILMGWLVGGGTTSTTAASVALRLLARGRAAGLEDEELVARYPTVLALVPPRIADRPKLPAVGGALPPLEAEEEVDEAAVLREALRLRVRWMHELSARAAWELGTRLARRGLLEGAELVRWMRWYELRLALTSASVPANLIARARGRTVAPLPARFHLARDGSV